MSICRTGCTEVMLIYSVDSICIFFPSLVEFRLFEYFDYYLFDNVNIPLTIIIRREGRKGSNYDDPYIMKVYLGTNDNDNEKKTRMAKNIIIENRLPSWLPNYRLLRE